MPNELAVEENAGKAHMSPRPGLVASWGRLAWLTGGPARIPGRFWPCGCVNKRRS